MMRLAFGLTMLTALCLGVAGTPCAAQEPSEKIRVILDTDANNELDDQHAIAYLLFNGDIFDVEAITVNGTRSGGDVGEHLAEAERVVKLCGLDGKIPVLRGSNGSFEQIKDHLDAPDFDGAPAVDFIIARAMAHEARQLVLLPVGKLTNIALALAKEPAIADKVRVVWPGTDYPYDRRYWLGPAYRPNSREYNQANDELAVNYLLDTNVHFEIAVMHKGKSSGTDAVRATLEDIRAKMPGKGPRLELPVPGRHGGRFTSFGDYSVDLFENIGRSSPPSSRALYDMAAVAIVKDPAWAKSRHVPAPILDLATREWVERPDNPRRIVIWEHFDRYAIMSDFYDRMENYILADTGME